MKRRGFLGFLGITAVAKTTPPPTPTPIPPPKVATPEVKIAKSWEACSGVGCFTTAIPSESSFRLLGDTDE